MKRGRRRRRRRKGREKTYEEWVMVGRRKSFLARGVEVG
jgi:hypothetical protein